MSVKRGSQSSRPCFVPRRSEIAGDSDEVERPNDGAAEDVDTKIDHWLVTPRSQPRRSYQGDSRRRTPTRVLVSVSADCTLVLGGSATCSVARKYNFGEKDSNRLTHGGCLSVCLSVLI